MKGNEPAFPHPDGSLNANGDRIAHENCGMTFRAYAATKVLAGIVSNESAMVRMHGVAKQNDSTMEAVVANVAVTCADALIAELAK